MKRAWKFWKWPEFLHSEGHKFYESKEAKEIYAKQLISFSEKIFWLAFAPVFGLLIKPEKFNLAHVGFAVFFMIGCGLFLRHQGLRIIDEIKTKKIEII